MVARPPSPTTGWSLEPTRRLLDELGHPERHFRAIHVGGTNGKGSVCALLEAALREAGYRVGRYLSPHLVDVRERMRVDGRPISEDALAGWVERLWPAVERVGATFFEATTVLALADFAARGVDLAVVEVGLGGRLDSTNVIQPDVSAVVQVARDHVEYLGESLADIAREKAGIAKAGAPFVIGEQDPALVAVLADAGRARGAPVLRVPPGARWEGPLGLAGGHQARNAAVAQAVLACLPGALAVDRAAVERGFAAARLEGRFERRGRWIFDVAHNVSGVDALASALRDARPPRPIHALVGILRDKDWGAMLARLDQEVDAVWLTTAPSAPSERRWDLAGASRALGGRATVALDFGEALKGVQRGAATVLVTGSFHTVGDALSRLPGFTPLG